MDHNKRDCTKLGLSILTAACLDPEALAPEHSDLLRDGVIADPDHFEPNAIVGLTNVGIMLLVMLEKLTGKPMESFLAEVGRTIAKDDGDT